MSEEHQNQEVENEVQEESVQSEMSSEDKARKMGWKPPEEAVASGLDPKDAVDADTYLDRKPFIKQINLEKQRNRSMAKKLDAILDKFDQAEQQGYQKAIQELQAQKDEALDEFDAAKARQIDQQMAQYQQQLAEKQRQRELEKQDDFPEAKEFVERNKDWWKVDQRTTQYAAMLEAQLQIEQPDLDPTDMYNIIQQKVDQLRGVAPKAPQQPKASYVAPPTRGGGSEGKSSHGFHDLTSEAKDIYMSMKEYRKSEFNKDYPVDEFVKDQLDTGIISKDELIR